MNQNYVEEIVDLRAINKNLMEDLKILNENLKVLVPGAIEKENESLKEIIAILQNVVEDYKKAEIEMDNETSRRNEAMSRFKYTCVNCNFESSSQRGLSVHIGRKHEEKKVNLMQF